MNLRLLFDSFLLHGSWLPLLVNSSPVVESILCCSLSPTKYRIPISLQVLYREIDYRDEANNAARFAENFAELPWVTTPKVYSELCTEKLLVMEFLPGVKVTDVETLEAKGYDRKQLASSLAKAYLYQFCKHGFFNTDPHPGNLAVDGGVPGGRLIFYDFGQACALSETQRDGVLATIEVSCLAQHGRRLKEEEGCHVRLIGPKVWCMSIITLDG